MASLDQYYYANGLNAIPNASATLHLCSSEPANFAAVAGVSQGNRANLPINAMDARPGGGWRRQAPIQTDGVVTAAAQTVCTHWALTDPASSRLIATGPLTGTTAERTATPGAPWRMLNVLSIELLPVA